MSKWDKAQEQEIVFWKAKWDFRTSYKKKYNLFLSRIEKISKDSCILDIGCGAVTFSGMFGFKNLWLVDSLIGRYRMCKNNLRKSIAQIKANAEYVLPMFNDGMFNNVFFLNCADHITPKSLDFIFSDLKRICCGDIFFYSDFRCNKEQCNTCHPFIFKKEDFLRLTEGFEKEF